MSDNIRLLVSKTLKRILNTGPINMSNNILILFYMSVVDIVGPPNFRDVDLINNLIDNIEDKYGILTNINSSYLIKTNERIFIKKENINQFNKQLKSIKFPYNSIYLPTEIGDIYRVIVLNQDETDKLRIKLINLLEVYEQVYKEESRKYSQWMYTLADFMFPFLALIGALGFPIIQEREEYSRYRSSESRRLRILNQGYLQNTAILLTTAPYIASTIEDSRSFSQLRRYTGPRSIHYN